MRYANRYAAAAAALGLMLSAACARPPLVEPVHPGATVGAGKVVVLASQKTAFGDAAIASFIAETDSEVLVISKVAEADSRLVVEAVERYKPDLVLTVGMQATLLARDHLQNLPILFMLVLNQGRHNLAGHANIMGIAMEIAPLVEFTQFKLVLPELKHVVAFYNSEQSEALARRAREELRGIGITLKTIAIQPQENAAELYAEHVRHADAVWILNDPVVIKQSINIIRLVTAAGLPVITSLSDSFARLGALMSMSVDIEAIGSQAAGMARAVLARHKSAAELGIQYPIGTRLVVNTDTLKHFNIKI